MVRWSDPTWYGWWGFYPNETSYWGWSDKDGQAEPWPGTRRNRRQDRHARAERRHESARTGPAQSAPAAGRGGLACRVWVLLFLGGKMERNNLIDISKHKPPRPRPAFCSPAPRPRTTVPRWAREVGSELQKVHAGLLLGETQH